MKLETVLIAVTRRLVREKASASEYCDHISPLAAIIRPMESSWAVQTEY